MWYRLAANHLTERLPAGAIVRAARFGLQDTAPRDGLLAMYARVDGCGPDDWAHRSLLQTYGPRNAVYVLPARDLGVFTLGRMPLDADERRAVESLAEKACRRMAGIELRGSAPELRKACVTGRIVVRWTTSALFAREVPRPEIDPAEARRELCRRYLRAFGPASPSSYAWWSGLSAGDAREVWRMLDDELCPVQVDGHRAWIRAEDEEPLAAAPEPEGTRLLPAPDLRLFGRDRRGLFAGPGQRRLSALQDTVHPNGILRDGEIVGVWGRRGGRVHARVERRLTAAGRRAIEDEALAMPIPGATMNVTLAG